MRAIVVMTWLTITCFSSFSIADGSSPLNPVLAATEVGGVVGEAAQGEGKKKKKKWRKKKKANADVAGDSGADAASSSEPAATIQA